MDSNTPTRLFNPHRLNSPKRQPRLLQLKIEIDLHRRSWQCYAGAAGAGRYLNFYAGLLPLAVARAGDQRANLFALKEAARIVAQQFSGAQIVCVEFEPEAIGAMLARVVMSGTAPQVDAGAKARRAA